MISANKNSIYAVILLMGAIVMTGINGCSSKFTYERYLAKDPDLNLSIDYISGWSHVESRGSYGSYAQVQFIEPKRDDKIFKASIAVTAQNKFKMKISPFTIDNISKDLISKRMQFKDAKVISQSKIQVDGIKGVNIGLSYKTLQSLSRPSAGLIDVEENAVMFIRNDKAYFITYYNAKEEFANLNKAFKHIIKSLRFN